MFQMLGVFAEFERSIIRERVFSGMARAKVQGTKSGKAIGRPSIPARTRDAIRAEHGKGGVSLRVVARRHHVGVETVRRCLAERAAQAVNDRACVVAPEDRREFITSVLMAIAGLIACGIVVLIASLIVSVLF